jgi:DNA segregation ATPase FtsK/SpoIIIE-like protein
VGSDWRSKLSSDNQSDSSSSKEDDNKSSRMSFRSKSGDNKKANDRKADNKKSDDKKSSSPFGGVTSRFGRGGNDDKKADNKKPDDKKSSSPLGGVTSRFGRGGNDDKKADNKKPDDKKSGSPLGGVTSRFSRGGNDDKKTTNKKPDDKKSSSPFGGVSSRFGRGGNDDKKADNKKSDDSGNAVASVMGGALGGFRKRFGSDDSSKDDNTSTSRDSGQFRNKSTSSTKQSKFGASKSTKDNDKKASAKDDKSSGGFFGNLMGRGRSSDTDSKASKPAARTRTSKAPKVEADDWFDLDRKLDLVGVGLVFGAIVLFFSALSQEQAAISAVHNFIGGLLGWGALAVPITMFAVGMWLIVRHFGDDAPTVDPIRLAGVVIGFIGMLTLFQYIESFNYIEAIPEAQQVRIADCTADFQDSCTQDIQNLAECDVAITTGCLEGLVKYSYTANNGGGIVGGWLYLTLVNNVTEIGGFVIVAMVLTFALMMVTHLSMAEIAVVAIGIGRSFRTSMAQNAARRRAQRLREEQQKALTAEAMSVSVSKPAPAQLPGFTQANHALPEPSEDGNSPIPIEERDILIRRGGQAFSSSELQQQPVLLGTNPAQHQPVQSGGFIGRLLGRNKAQPQPVQQPQPNLGTAAAATASAGIVGRLFNRNNNPAPQQQPIQQPMQPNPAYANTMPAGQQPVAQPTQAPVQQPVQQPTAQPQQMPVQQPVAYNAQPQQPVQQPTAQPQQMPQHSSLYSNHRLKYLYSLHQRNHRKLLHSNPLHKEMLYHNARTASMQFVADKQRHNLHKPNRLRHNLWQAMVIMAMAIIHLVVLMIFQRMNQKPYRDNNSVQQHLFRPVAHQHRSTRSRIQFKKPVSSGPKNNTRPRINWKLPDYRTLLSSGSEQEFDREHLLNQARVIEETLASFGAPGRVVEVNTGPVITQFGVEPDYLTARSGKKSRVKVSAIAQLDKDLQLALGAKSIRVEAPVPGKGYVGIEVPNTEASLVSLRDVMESEGFQKIKSPLAIALGMSVDGTPISADLTGMPHLLIAGTTGSGKSVCVNAIINSIVATNAPEQVKFIMVDPKRVELTGYNGLPHLIAPVVVELERIVGVLKWVTREMDERYKKFSNMGARNIIDYNKHRDENVEQMPYIVVIIDELADLMMLAPEETERTITRIAALARATGIHLVIATQRPSVDVVTGLIKANFPARIAFAVAGGVDSRVILDQPGAERLLGKGDMLYLSGDSPAPLRLQGVFVSDMEIANIGRYWKAQSVGVETIKPISSLTTNSAPTPQPHQTLGATMAQAPATNQSAFWDNSSDDSDPSDPNKLAVEDKTGNPDPQDDELYQTAVDMVRRLDKASISLLQRRLRIGYTRAARLIDIMEERGVVGPSKEGSSKPRDVLPE